VTPAEHAATVREQLDDDGTYVSKRTLASLAALVALAERAQKLEMDADAVVGAMKAAEARATELAGELVEEIESRAKWKARSERERERAERAETALRPFARRPYTHPKWEEIEAARAALRETAPRISDEGMMQPHYRPGDLGPVDVDALGETAPTDTPFDSPNVEASEHGFYREGKRIKFGGGEETAPPAIKRCPTRSADGTGRCTLTPRHKGEHVFGETAP
jgi:hypothetical protein